MNVTVLAYGTWGDVRPAAALAVALQERGHQVRLMVTRDFASWVRDQGLEVRPFPVDKYRVMRDVSSETNPLRALMAIRRWIAPALVQAGRALVAMDGETDVLVANEWLLGLADGVARRRGMTLIHLATQPILPTREMPICTLPALPEPFPFRPAYNRMTYSLAYRLRWWTHGRALNTLRARELGLPPLGPGDYADLFARTPAVTAVSRHVVPRPRDWPTHHHLTGYLFYDEPGWRPSAALVAFLAAGPPPVYVGFGSMHDRQPGRTTEILLEALRRSGQRGLLQRGWAGLGQTDLPESVYLLDSAPHHWLFPRVAAVVHHAGAGTTAAALRAGVPSVPVPHGGDQFFWARRLRELGAGTRPLPRARLEATALADRIRQAVEEEDLRARARALGVKIRRERGGPSAVAAIEAIVKA